MSEKTEVPTEYPTQTEKEEETVTETTNEFKIHTNAAALEAALKMAKKGLTGRSTQPVQQQVRLSADGDVFAVASDLEFLEVQVPIQASTAGIGAVMLDCAKVEKLLKGKTKGEVPVTIGAAGDKGVSLKVGDTAYTLTGYDASDHQTIASGLDVSKHTIILSEEELCAILDRTTYALSSDETRPILTGLLFDFPRDRVCATDTYRLAAHELGGVGESVGAQCIVAARALKVLRSLLKPKGERSVTMKLHEAVVWDRKEPTLTTVEFAVGDDVIVRTRTIDGQFPNCDKVIPDESLPTRMTVRVGDLRRAITDVMPIAEDDAKRVVVQGCPGPDGDELRVSARAQEYIRDEESRAETFIPCTLNDECWRAFNGKYMLDTLAVFDDDDIVAFKWETRAWGVDEDGNVRWATGELPEGATEASVYWDRRYVDIQIKGMGDGGLTPFRIESSACPELLAVLMLMHREMK